MSDWQWLTIVQDRGFVLVGEFRQDPDDFLFLAARNVSVVRRWGTTAGLGQLAREGKQPDTVLDPEDCVSVSKLHVYRVIRCNPEVWR